MKPGAARGRSAMIVGGGIGGLAAAIALARRGWEVEVSERATGTGEAGSGLSLWPNALRALAALGLDGQVLAEGRVETEAGIRRSSGRWLLRTDTDALARSFGPLVVIHRARLLAILRAAVPAGALRPGREVTAVEAGDGEVLVRDRDGVRAADLVIGADGIDSTVRTSLWPDAPSPTYAGYTAWRLIAEAPDGPLAGGETWGRGERFGVAPLGDGRVYAFATAGVRAGERAPGGERAELRRRFGEWHEPIPAILGRVEEAAILRHDVRRLPPLDRLAGGRVALLGDAAHAMTPDLGQGACQALEDAVTLAALLDRHAGLEDALAAYDAARRPRTRLIADRSRRVGRVAQWRSRPATALRDAAMAATPAAAQLRSLAEVLSWTPPA